jgi:chemotaxis protein CheX
MSAQRNQELIAELVVRSTEELFAAYEVEVEVSRRPGTNSESADEVFAGVIGFTGDSMRGTLVLAPTRALLERSHRGLSCELRDWAGELANQLLGRIKNRLRGVGIEIHVTTPVVLRGHYIVPTPRGDGSLQCVATSPGKVMVWFDGEVEPGTVLALRVVESGPIEGESVIF